MNLSWNELATGFATQRDFCKGYSALYEAICEHAFDVVSKRAAERPLEAYEKAVIDLLDKEWAERTFHSSTDAVLVLPAAIHAAVLNGDSEAEPLKRFYATVGGSYLPQERDALVQALKALYLKPSTTFRDFLRLQKISTNEVSRGITWLLPALVFDRSEPGLPITLIDLGCSMGLNLIADMQSWQWRVVQGEPRTLNGADGENALILQQLDFGVETEVRRLLATGPHTAPNLVKRVGFDLNPPRPDDPTAIAVLPAFIRGDRKDRLERFDRALASFKRAEPAPEIHTADMIEDARSLPTQITPDTKLLLVYNTAVTHYLTHEQYAQLNDNVIGSFRQLPPHDTRF